MDGSQKSVWVEFISRQREYGVVAKCAFAVLSALLLLSVFGGPELLDRIGLGFLGRWGAWVLWLGTIVAFSIRGRSTVVRWPGRSPEWILAIVLVLSLVLRWPMASLDLEHYVGPDEGQLVEGTLEMMKAGDLHPRHPGYPGLFFYLQMIPATAHLLLTSPDGEKASIQDLPREGFYRVIRQMTLLAGLAAALVVYLIGWGWVGRAGAVLAAALVALSPLAFRESKVVNPDLLLMFFVTCSLWLSLRASKDPRTWNFVWAGISIGLATAIKYTGAMLAVPYIVAWWLGGEPRRRVGPAILGLVVSVVAFIVASPYSLLDLPAFLRGLGAHYGYYQAAQMNAPEELSRILVTTGLGAAAAIAAFIGSLRVLTRLEKQGLVLLSFPLAYLLLFSFFQRAYPRHAIVLLPTMAVLASWIVVSCLESRRYRWFSYLAFAVVLAQPMLSTIRMGLAARRASTTPAEQARQWIEANIPSGSRILEDQLTPRLDPEKYLVRRMRVEEKVFAGNYDWVLRSGYPPGLPLEGLRRVVRFAPGKSLGTAITLYQVPDREIMMGATLDAEEDDAVLMAGHLPYFGEGWHSSSPSAFGTARLSRGLASELFFVIEGDGFPTNLMAELRVSCVAADRTMVVQLELNDHPLAALELEGDVPEEYGFVLPGPSVRIGLNRLMLRYGETVRLNRRHRETAMRFYSLILRKEEEVEGSRRR